MDPEMTGNGSDDRTTALSKGIAAARAGDRERARHWLMQVVTQDERNLEAWLWLTDMVDTPEDQEICLENILTLEPDHEVARRELARIRQRAAAEDDRAPIPPVQTREQALGLDFSNDRLCPYCATVETRPEDLLCPACRQPLWIEFWRQDPPSRHHAIYLGMQWFLLVNSLGLAVLSYTLIDALPRIQEYLRQQYPPDQPMPFGIDFAAINQLVQFDPRPGLIVSIALFTFSLVSIAGFYFRWKPAYYLSLGGTALGAILSLFALALLQNWGLCVTAIGLPACGAFLQLTLKTEDDFVREKRRIWLCRDRDMKNPAGAAAPLERGQRYMEKQLWALAALHFHQAAMLMPGGVDAHLALAAAYLQLGRRELAGQSLQEARSLSPDNPRLHELEALLRDITTDGRKDLSRPRS